MGILTSFSGNFPDTSGVTISQYGTIYTGMVDWLIDDSNSVLNYNMSSTNLAYQLTTTSLSSSKFSYFWYRKLTCPDYTFLNGTVCQSCHFSCLTCIDSASTSCLTCPTTRTYISTNRTCACITNYIDVNVSLCVQLTCQYSCSTCANLNQCATCNSGYGRILNGTDCICKGYTVDVYATMGTIICYPCYATCYSCSSPFLDGNCLSCNSVKDHRTYFASNNTCIC
jgi:hypothetical protein